MPIAKRSINVLVIAAITLLLGAIAAFPAIAHAEEPVNQTATDIQDEGVVNEWLLADGMSEVGADGVQEKDADNAESGSGFDGVGSGDNNIVIEEGKGNVEFDSEEDAMGGAGAGNETVESQLEEPESAIDGEASTTDVTDKAENAEMLPEELEAISVKTTMKTTSAKALSATSTSGSVLVIALDPGHGGSDSGATGNGYLEKDLNLSIAKAMKTELEKYAGVKVILTRTGDYYVGLSERVTIAENAGASVFISIHINSGGGTGFEVWAPTRSSNYNATQRDEAWALSNKVLDNLVGAYGLTNRGVKSKQSTSGDTYADGSTSDYFTVIDGSRRAGMVGILIEHGFIDNSSDASKLYSGSNTTRMGQLDAKAVVDQFKLSTEERPVTTAEVVDNESIKLSWKAIEGATRYAIALRNADDTYKTYTYDCTATTYTVTGLKTGHKYTFLVQAYMKDHWTSYAEYNHVTIALTEAPKPTATNPADGVVKLTWTAISGASKYAIAVKNSDGSYATFTYNCEKTSYTIPYLTPGKKYQFLVQAYYPGDKIWSTFTDANLVASTPTGISKPAPKATAASISSVKLTWDAVTNASKYAIAVKNGNSYKTYTYNCEKTSFTITGLSEGTTYEFLVQAYVKGRVQASVKDSWTSFSDADLVRYRATDPTSPVVTAKATGDGTVQLTWNKVSGATKYAIAEKMADGTYKTFTYNCTNGAYTVSNLSNGKAHRFIVQANVNGKWSSSKDMHLVSATPSGATKPTAKAVSASATQVKLTWNKVSGATKYAIAYKNGSGYTTYTYNCTGTSYTAGGLNEGTTYQFLVQAMIDGKWSSFTSNDHVAIKLSDPTAPVVTAKATGDGTVQLTWNKVSGATKYAIAEKMADGTYKTFTYNCTDGAYTVSNLSNGKAHRFVVQANVNGKWSSYKDMHLVSATPSGTVKPTAKVSATTANTVKLTWNKVSGATKYAIASKNANGSFKTYTYNCTKTYFTVSGLSSGTTYQFLVQALIDDKWSAYGNSDLVTGKTTGTASSGYAIMGSSSYTAAQLAAAFKKNGTYPSSVYSSKGAATIEAFCNTLVAQANKEGVKAEVLFAQAMLETGWLKFGGSVKPEQCNFGGIGATSSTVSGATFSSVAEGLLAQTQHLKAYASTAALNTTCVDPRFNLVTRGSATTVEALSGKWATSSTYGADIRSIIDRI